MQTFLDSVPPAKIVHVRFYGQEVDNTGTFVPGSESFLIDEVTRGPIPGFHSSDECNDDAIGGSGQNWEYATAHTASRGEKVVLNSDGTLGPLQTEQLCYLNGVAAQVGCCQ